MYVVPEQPSQRSMIDFVILSSDLRSYVFDTRVKRGAELSTDHHLVVSWGQVEGEASGIDQVSPNV